MGLLVCELDRSGRYAALRLMRFVAAVSTPLLLIPGVRAVCWPTWSYLLFGGVLYASAWAGIILPVSSPLRTAAYVELFLYAIGTGLILPLGREGHIIRVYGFIRGNELAEAAHERPRVDAGS